MTDVKTASATELVAQTRQQSQMSVIDQMDTFDWKKLPPPVMANLLTKIPFKGRKDEPDYYLNPAQAMVFALRCFELGLSPFSSEVWFDRDKYKVNTTLEGKKKLARDSGFNYGPPQYSEQRRPHIAKDSYGKPKQLPPGYTEDVGITCEMEVRGFAKPATYTAWLSEWYVPSSPVWKDKPMHMLQTRAQEKAISVSSGVGSSDMPVDAEIAPPPPPVFRMPELSTTEFVAQTNEKENK